MHQRHPDLAGTSSALVIPMTGPPAELGDRLEIDSIGDFVIDFEVPSALPPTYEVRRYSPGGFPLAATPFAEPIDAIACSPNGNTYAAVAGGVFQVWPTFTQIFTVAEIPSDMEVASNGDIVMSFPNDVGTSRVDRYLSSGALVETIDFGFSAPLRLERIRN